MLQWKKETFLIELSIQKDIFLSESILKVNQKPKKTLWL